MPAAQLVSKRAPALLLVNPEAGGGRTLAYLPRVERYFASQLFPVEVVCTGSAQELEARAKAAIAGGRRLLIAMGGDGTFQGLANAAAGTDTLLGIVPAGGGNDFAAAAGLPKDPLAAAQALLYQPPRWMDLLRARTADGQVRLYAGGGGIGLDAEAARYASGAFRRLPGALRYVAAALAALRTYAPVEVTAEFPEGEHAPLRAEVLLAAVLNTPHYGAGLRLAPAAQPDDGRLDVVLVGSLRLLELMDLLPQLAQSGDVRIPQITRVHARRVRLSAARQALFHGDGEILGCAPVEIQVAPRAVRILGAAANGKS
ncbi:MAG: diacylglycerol kinase family lipid kinase [Acidobacteriia bacterium]|nr:diacylglycerol kinase family lipid kinase [Terriglobia bacterium]